MDRKGLESEGPITIVAFGDSVTHGVLTNGVIDYETAYWNILKKKINNLRNYIPVNVICAGIGGVSAKTSVIRVDKQVVAHSPDLVIVCFGLNDVNGELDVYLSSLKTIFEKCKNCGADVIFMTPNMLNTYVADDTNPQEVEYAAITAEFQNSGKMDLFMESAVKLATDMDVEVCDCYSKWKELSITQDTTKLLINRINHPDRDGHKLFADMLFDVIFKDFNVKDSLNISTMYEGE